MALKSERIFPASRELLRRFHGAVMVGSRPTGPATAHRRHRKGSPASGYRAPSQFFRKPSRKAAELSARQAFSLRPARDAFVLLSTSLSEAGRSCLAPGMSRGHEGRHGALGDRRSPRSLGRPRIRVSRSDFRGIPVFEVVHMFFGEPRPLLNIFSYRVSPSGARYGGCTARAGRKPAEGPVEIASNSLVTSRKHVWTGPLLRPENPKIPH